MLRFLHTADLQLGMPFNRIEGDAGARLRQFRLDALDTLAGLARHHDAAFVLVAGDVYDSTVCDDALVFQSLERFASFHVPVVIIPGNHDHLGDPACPFNRRSFRQNKPAHVHVLESGDPFVLEPARCVVLPAPLCQRHAVGDTTRHITAELGAGLLPDAFRVGLAHGGLPFFRDDPESESPNEIAVDRASAAKLDYLALGDWHGTYRHDERTWYSGTPEQTRFKEKDPGNALLVEIDHPGAAPRVTPIRTGKARWLRKDATLNNASDIASLAAWFDALPDRLSTLVDLDLSGSLTLEDRSQLDDLLSRWRGTLLHLRADDAIVPRPDDAEIDSIAGEGYLRAAVDSLRSLARSDSPDAAIAADAINLLYQLKRQGGGA